MKPNQDWENAYLEYESSEDKIKKFKNRLKTLPLKKNISTVLDVFCGSGENTVALNSLGFQNIIQLDLSRSLLAAKHVVSPVCADACNIPLSNGSIDLVLIQGGLHHLPSFEHYEFCIAEIHRIMKSEAEFYFMEPFLTIRMKLFLAGIQTPFANIFKTTRAIKIMVDKERKEYFYWLNNWDKFKELLIEFFVIHYSKKNWHMISCGMKKIT